MVESDAERSDASLLAELRGMRRDLAPIKARQAAIYARRLEVFRELDGRGVDHAVIAEAFGVTQPAVTVALHKGRKAAADEDGKVGAPQPR